MDMATPVLRILNHSRERVIVALMFTKRQAGYRGGYWVLSLSGNCWYNFATHMLEHGVNIRVLQELLSHADVKTTEIYTQVMARGIRQLQSPLDRLSPDDSYQG
jgi:integrase